MKKTIFCLGLLFAGAAPARDVLISYPNANADGWRNCYNSLATQLLSSLGLSRYQIATYPAWHYSYDLPANVLPGGNTVAKWKAPSADGNDFVTLTMRIKGGVPADGSSGYTCISWFPSASVLESIKTSFWIKDAKGHTIAQSTGYVNEQPRARSFRIENYKLRVRIED